MIVSSQTSRINDAAKSPHSPLTEFKFGPLHGTRMRIVGEPDELLFLVHGRRAVYVRVTDLDGEAVYYDADEWESYDAEPYADDAEGER